MWKPQPDYVMYWTHLQRYEIEGCPQKFLWHHGWGDIDLGRGPGKSKPKPQKKSRHHAVMGIVIQSVIEEFYLHELWRKTPEADMKDHTIQLRHTLSRMAGAEFENQIGTNYIDWRRAPSHEEMKKVCVDGVLGYLQTMARHKLLGPYAKSEVSLNGHIDNYNAVGGRADMIIRREDNGLTIVDGKNSMTKLATVDTDQLRWYAMCYFLNFGVMPDRLGFVWFRYPYDEETGEEGVDWVPFEKRDLRDLAERAVETRKKMTKQLFPAAPSSKACKWCDYERVCPERQAKRQAGAQGKTLPVLEGGEMVDFSFDTDGTKSSPKTPSGSKKKIQ